MSDGERDYGLWVSGVCVILAIILGALIVFGDFFSKGTP